MQLTDRAATLAQNGHPVDKIELAVNSVSSHL